MAFISAIKMWVLECMGQNRECVGDNQKPVYCMVQPFASGAPFQLRL